MKRAIALAVAVAYLMQLTGCAVYRIHRQRPTEAPLPPDELLGGAITVSGEKLRFETTQGWLVPPMAWIEGDTLYYLHRGKSQYKLALDEVQVLLVKRKDPTLSTIATVALCATIIATLYAFFSSLEYTSDGSLGWWWGPPDFGGGVG